MPNNGLRPALNLDLSAWSSPKTILSFQTVLDALQAGKLPRGSATVVNSAAGVAKLQSLAQAHGLKGKFALLLKASDSVQKPEHTKSLKLACWVSNHRELTSCWAIPLCGDQLPALPQATPRTTSFCPQDRDVVTIRITVPKPCVEAAVWQQWHATPWAALKQWANSGRQRSTQPTVSKKLAWTTAPSCLSVS